jgi:hypothetical protein
MRLPHTTSNCAPVSAAPSARAHKELARRVNPRLAPAKIKRKTALILKEQIMNNTFMHAAEIPKNLSPVNNCSPRMLCCLPRLALKSGSVRPWAKFPSGEYAAAEP